jgi:hypothetical protein
VPTLYVPPDTLGQIEAYVNHRIPLGGFLHAVFANNLEVACGKADDKNRAHLCNIVDYVSNYCPVLCRGSPAKVQAWLERKELDPDGR